MIQLINLGVRNGPVGRNGTETTDEPLEKLQGYPDLCKNVTMRW